MNAVFVTYAQTACKSLLSAIRFWGLIPMIGFAAPETPSPTRTTLTGLCTGGPSPQRPRYSLQAPEKSGFGNGGLKLPQTPFCMTRGLLTRSRLMRTDHRLWCAAVLLALQVLRPPFAKDAAIAFALAPKGNRKGELLPAGAALTSGHQGCCHGR